MDLIDHAIRLKDGRFAYIAPLRNQAKTVSWDYLKDFARPIFGKPPNEAELHVDLLNGSRITLYGADNPDALRGPFFDGVVLDEYADIAPSLLSAVVRPALADRKGFAVLMGTIKGRNQLWQAYTAAQKDEAWYTALLRASETGILSADELADAKRLMTPESYAAEFECDPSAGILGAYYGREMTAIEQESRDGKLEPIPERPIHCAWDFGNGLNMAVWAFQVGERGPLILDFIQMSGCYFEDYLKEVVKRGYEGFDYVPHDARVPSFETGRTRIETMAAFKRNPVLIADHHVDDGINAVKLMLPRVRFNGVSCASGIEALKQYRQEWDERARVFKKTPAHNWASHAADAMRYLAMAWREMRHEAPPPPKPMFIPIEEMTYGDFIKFSKGEGKRERI